MKNINLQLVILVLLGIFFGLYFYTGEQMDFYDRAAKPAAEVIIKDISQWQPGSLKKHLSQQALSTLDDQKISKLLDHYRQFGELVELGELEFSRLASALSIVGSARISYQSDATFSKKAARITLTLVVEDQQYKVYNFSIHPAN